MVILLQVGRRI